MTIDETIKHAEKVAEKNEENASWFWTKEGNPNYEKCVECAKEHRQLAEWLRELKVHREIHDVLLQQLVDSGLDICCDDLVMDEEEQQICEENCVNQTKGCWVRWAKMKAKEKCKDASSN